MLKNNLKKYQFWAWLLITIVINLCNKIISVIISCLAQRGLPTKDSFHYGPIKLANTMAPVIILFLDFDGVLHPDPPTSEAPLFCRAGLFQQFLHRHLGVAVVVSSTWRRTRTLAQLQALFPDWSDRIIGATSLSMEANYARQFECEAWMRENAAPWTRWVSLDDRSWNYRPFERRLVLVERSAGLRLSDLERLSGLVKELSG